MLPVAVCGASGYTGGELLRILKYHQNVEVVAITSERNKGKHLTTVHPHLRGFYDLSFISIKDPDLLKKAELFFTALPHGQAQEWVAHFYKKGKFVIDLSADYRLQDPAVYSSWYGLEHSFPEIINDAVYGLPEQERTRIMGTRLVANPGCYPTSAIIGLLPVLREGLIERDGIVIDSKSGTSGAGRKESIHYSFCEINEAFKAYSVGKHRHTPEIEQQLSKLAGEDIRVEFTPHLLPINRGILTTIYCKATTSDPAQVLDIYKGAYEKEPFVRLLDSPPDLRNVRGTNFCDLWVYLNKRTGRLIIVTAIDNLVKGASGQAVQNMNIMMNFPETEGLLQPPAVP